MKKFYVQLLTLSLVILLGGCSFIPPKNAISSTKDEIVSDSTSGIHPKDLQTTSETTDTGLSDSDSPDSDAAFDKGIYIKYGEDYYIFGRVTEDGTPLPDKGVFYASIPKGQLYDINGEKITRKSLNPGNLVKISGDLIYEASDPATCCNITQMRVIDQGTPGDAAAFGKALNIRFPSPPPSEQPLLQVEIEGDGMVYYYIDFPKYGYEWTWENEDGTTSSSIADSLHVLDIEDLTEVEEKDNKTLTLHFTKAPVAVDVTCWPVGTPSSEADQGTQVEGTLKGKDYTLKNAPAGCVYQVRGIWESGFVNFGFLLE